MLPLCLVNKGEYRLLVIASGLGMATSEARPLTSFILAVSQSVCRVGG